MEIAKSQNAAKSSPLSRLVIIFYECNLFDGQEILEMVYLTVSWTLSSEWKPDDNDSNLIGVSHHHLMNFFFLPRLVYFAPCPTINGNDSIKQCVRPYNHLYIRERDRVDGWYNALWS